MGVIGLLGMVILAAVVGLVVVGVSYIRAMERTVAHALASDKSWEPSKEQQPMPEMQETTDIEEFEQEQDELAQMELRHISKAARL